MAHVILLGDSIFDNWKYVQPEPDVSAQLQEMLLPNGWKACLRAVDCFRRSAATTGCSEF